MTHTYALLTVSGSTYREVRRLLLDAGYSHAIHVDGDPREPEVIDMHGIALVERRSSIPASTPAEVAAMLSTPGRVIDVPNLDDK